MEERSRRRKASERQSVRASLRAEAERGWKRSTVAAWPAINSTGKGMGHGLVWVWV